MKNLILVFALFLSPFTFSQTPQQARNYTIAGITEPDVYPLMDEMGQFIQWNAPTYEGFVFVGKTNKQECQAPTPRCYSYDGRGNWSFRLTGDFFCTATCTYLATGALVVGDPIALPDGSQVRYLTANLTGTWTDQDGVVYPNLLGYYSTYTAPTVGWSKDEIPVPAFGGITIVLQDN